MFFLARWAVNIIALLAVTYIVPGISVDKWQTAVFAALVIGLINAFLKPLVILFTIPISILSLGFFTLIINGFMFYLASKVVPGFIIVDFWHAFWGALLFSIISFFVSLFLKFPGGGGNGGFRFYKYSGTRKPKYDNVIDIKGKIEE